MEKNIIFLYPLNEVLNSYKDQLEILNEAAVKAGRDEEYEVYEIDSLDELSQTIPILQELIVFSTDLKKTNTYLDQLKDYTSGPSCLCLMLDSKTIPPHVFNNLQNHGLSEVLKSETPIKTLEFKVERFFATVQLPQSFENKVISNKNQDNQNKEWQLQKGVLADHMPENKIIGATSSVQNKEWQLQKGILADQRPANQVIGSSSSDMNGEWQLQRGLIGEESKFHFAAQRVTTISENISTRNKNRIEKLIIESKENKDKSFLQRLKNNELNLIHFHKIKNKIIDNKATPTNLDDDFVSVSSFEKKLEDKTFEYEKDPNLDKINVFSNVASDSISYSEMHEEENKVESKNTELSKFVVNKKKKVLEITYKSKSSNNTEYLLDFYRQLNKEQELYLSYSSKDKLSEGNPFLSFFGDNIPKELIELEQLKEIDFSYPVSHEFLYIIGMAEVLGEGRSNANKMLHYLNFIFFKKYEAILGVFVTKKNDRLSLLKGWDISAFSDRFKDVQELVEEQFNNLMEHNLPHFETFDEWGIFIYPFYWDQVKRGMGLVILKSPLSEQDLLFMEFCMLSARNIVYEEYKKC
jgi:hypothetical protein